MYKLKHLTDKTNTVLYTGHLLKADLGMKSNQQQTRNDGYVKIILLCSCKTKHYGVQFRYVF